MLSWVWLCVVLFATAEFGCATDTSVAEAKTMIARGAAVLDVRTADEFAERHLADAINIPVNELKARLNELEKGRPIVVYCHSGARAGAAAVILRKAGFTVHNLGSIGHYYAGDKASGTSDSVF